MFVNTLADHDPGLGFVFLHRIDIDFSSVSLKVLVYSRHELVQPNPAKVTKNCPGEMFL